MPDPQTLLTTQPATESSERVLAAEVVFVTDINRLPLLAYMDAMVEGDFAGIIVSGTPAAEQITDAWDALKSQSVELSATQSQQQQFSSDADRYAEQTRLNCLSVLLLAAVTSGDSDMVEALANEGYELDLSADPEAVAAQIRRIEAQLKGDMLRMQLDAPPEQEQEDRKPITREWFYNILDACEAEYKMLLPAESISAGKFFRSLKRLCEEGDRRRQAATRTPKTPSHEHH